MGGIPTTFSSPSGAQNQECLPAFPFGPTGGLGVQNLESLRSSVCAWVCRANASRADYTVGPAQSAAPTGIGERLSTRRSPEPYLSPTHLKGALPTDRSTA